MNDTATDSDRALRRKAGFIATAVAVPIAVLAGWGASVLLRPDLHSEPMQAASTDPVEVEALELDEERAIVCRALTSALPERLDDLAQRPVEGGPGVAEHAAAWGDPAAVLRCGVEAVGVDPEAQVYVLGETCWYAQEEDGGTRWTSVDRGVPVEVTVPADYEQPGQVVQALSDAVADKVAPSADEDVPSGCFA